MSSRKPQSAPAGFDDYLKTAHGNAAKIIARGGVWIRLLREVDAAFVLAAQSLKPEPGTVVGAFVVGSHGSWLAAANLGLCMHAADSFQPLRACVESAFYGYYIYSDHAAFVRWKRRPTESAILGAKGTKAETLRKTRKAVGREFSVSAITRTFPASLASLRDRSVQLYEELIDFGAHFNFPVLSRAFRATGMNADDIYSAEVRILLAREPEQVFTFRKLIEGGICALEILNAAIGDAWDSPRVESKIARLKTSLATRPTERLRRRK